jgi:hypothetical protein
VAGDAGGERGAGGGGADGVYHGAMTCWPGADTFPSVTGHVGLLDVSRLQRHLLRAHEAAAAVRKVCVCVCVCA